MTMQELNFTATARLPLSTPLSQLVFVAFDTETTGLSPVASRLVELSGVKFRLDGQELSTFQALINPQTAIPDTAYAVHGISHEMVENEPTYDVVVPKFLDWALAANPAFKPEGANQTVLVAHNAPFDMGFLEVALCKLNLPAPENLILDTLIMSRALITDALNYQLRTLVEHLSFDASTYHRALADSYHVRNLFCRMVQDLGPQADLQTLLEVSGRLQFLDRTQAEAESRWATDPEFARIKQAIADGIDLRIFYSGMRKTERVVTPLSVLFTGGNPYLSAFCHMVSAERTFRVDKIVWMEMLGK